ncbi:MAG: sodium:alanine symporter family protein [Bacilli bacterium]|nr:sodium:alanine symporter family protein [Bacilli bacterium]
MKMFITMIGLIIVAIILNIFDYNSFLDLLSITWYIASILIIYSGIKYSFKYKFIQFKIKEFIKAIKSKSKNNISPLSSLSMSLAAKIGVGSLSGVALCLYFGGIGSIFWMCIISLIVSINTYVECILGIKYRDKVGNSLIGGPSFYIKKCLNNKCLSILYGILIIITYSGLFLSIQSNTIVSVISDFDINITLIVIVLSLVTFIIIKKESKNIFLVDSILVPFMLIFYLLMGLYVLFNSSNILDILKLMVRDAFKIKSIIPLFLVGMQRAIFISESGIGTSAISASACDNDPDKQGKLEILGIHITTFLVCFITFLIIVTSNYNIVDFGNINGIEIVMYAFNYHFGNFGKIILAIITTMFAFSTIISGYFFGENNVRIFTNNKKVIKMFKIFVIVIIFISGYISPNILWNLTDYFIAILAIINISSIIRINR